MKKYTVILRDKSTNTELKKVETDFLSDAESAYSQFCQFHSVTSGNNICKLFINKYVPYGVNTLWYVYDNEKNCIPLGYGNKAGTKKTITSICEKLNEETLITSQNFKL